jgi:CRP/FNR family cyclic AMP-dependent transcriptional regulator
VAENADVDTGKSQLSVAGRTRLAAVGQPRTWAPGAELIREAEPDGRVLLITRGRVKVTSASPCGRQVILALRGPGDLVGESAAIDGGGRSATVTALTEVDTVHLTRKAFHHVVRTVPDITYELLEILVCRLRESTRSRLARSVYDVRTRTAQWLLGAAEHGEPIDGGAGYVVHLTQDELAEAVGTSRVSVNKALRFFRDHGAISTSRAVCTVKRPDWLRDYVTEATDKPKWTIPGQTSVTAN